MKKVKIKRVTPWDPLTPVNGYYQKDELKNKNPLRAKASMLGPHPKEMKSVCYPSTSGSVETIENNQDRKLTKCSSVING